MEKFFIAEDENFFSKFKDFLNIRTELSNNVSTLVSEVIENIKKNSDSALIELTKKFDNVNLTEIGFFHKSNNTEKILKRCGAEDKRAVDLAIARITTFHEKQLPKNYVWKDELGVELGWVWKPIDRVGVYVPGGKASYPSSAIMNIVPAKVAGVKEVVLTSPITNGQYNPLMLYAALSLNVNEILHLGGAQAIAALSFGTETIKSVNKITGPGNEYVAEAKRQVFGKVGIDSVAGPSEVLLICDNKMPKKLAAIDLLSQAEHDELAQAILITNDYQYAQSVLEEIERYLNKLKRRTIARSSWDKFGAIVIVPDFKKAIEIANFIAPEHLQLCFSDCEKYLDQLNNAGSVFLGRWSPEAMGDYITGSNHVLPTMGTAKFSSALSVLDFMKRISITKLNGEGFENLAPHVINLANSEGLEAHSLSVSERLNDIE